VPCSYYVVFVPRRLLTSNQKRFKILLWLACLRRLPPLSKPVWPFYLNDQANRKEGAMDTFAVDQCGCATCEFWRGRRIADGKHPRCVKAECNALGACAGCRKGEKKTPDQGSPTCWHKWSELTH